MDDALERTKHALNLSWLLKLRWVAIVGQLTLTLVVDRFLSLPLEMPKLLAVLGFEAASNVLLFSWSRRRREVEEWTLTAVLTGDVLLLSVLLLLTGGGSNPFSFLYAVHITMAAVFLRTAGTWFIACLSLLCYGILFLLPQPDWTPLIGDGLGRFATWSAFLVATVVVTYFVNRIQRDLAHREEELDKIRAQRARDEKLASLATLAAGAAHELATPLSTIAVAAKEMERSLTGDASEDARLIRTQVERCRLILQQMAARAGETFGESSEPIALPALLGEVTQSLVHRGPIRVDLGSDFDKPIRLPGNALTQALHGIIKNAQDASPAGQAIDVRLKREGSTLIVVVEDHGHGMSAEVLGRASEPFFTTKEPGQGMGLGLFLARSVLERLGGTLEIDSEPWAGTKVSLRIPVRA